jgi:hypothetical protein
MPSFIPALETGDCFKAGNLASLFITINCWNKNWLKIFLHNFCSFQILEKKLFFLQILLIFKLNDSKNCAKVVKFAVFVKVVKSCDFALKLWKVVKKNFGKSSVYGPHPISIRLARFDSLRWAELINVSLMLAGPLVL